MILKLNSLNEGHLWEVSRKDLVAKSRVQDKKRFNKRLNYQVSNFRGVDLQKLFEDDYFVFTTPINDYVCTVAFPGVFSSLKKVVKSTKGDSTKIDLQMVIKALRIAFDATDDVKVNCTCGDWCLHPDTKIKLLEGTSLPVSYLYEEFLKGRDDLWVYSVDGDTGDFRPGHVSNVWITGYTSEFVKVTLDNGKEVLTTPDHQYLLRNGVYLRAEDLVEGQSLMPLYFQNNSSTNGYETVKYNSRSHGYNSVYKEVAQSVLLDEIDEAKKRSGESCIVIHHKNFNKLDNRPENLMPMGTLEHWHYHAEFISERRKLDGEFDQKLRNGARKHCYEMNRNPTEALVKSRSESGRALAEKINSDPELRDRATEGARSYQLELWKQINSLPEDERAQFLLRFKKSDEDRETLSQAQKKVWERYADGQRAERGRLNSINLNGEYGEKASERAKSYWENLSDEEYQRRCEESSQRAVSQGFGKLPKSESQKRKIAESQIERYKDPEERTKATAHLNTPECHKKAILGRYRKVLEKIVADGMSLTQENFAKYKSRSTPKVETYFNSFDEMLKYFGYENHNHRIVKVERVHLNEKVPVYDLTVDTYENFLVDAGVILHNCYRFAYWATKNGYKYGNPETRPSDITNPDDALGATCKHLDLLLSNKRWLTKAASVVNAFIKAYPEKAANYLYDDLPSPKSDEEDNNEVKDDETQNETSQDTTKPDETNGRGSTGPEEVDETENGEGEE